MFIVCTEISHRVWIKGQAENAHNIVGGTFCRAPGVSLRLRFSDDGKTAPTPRPRAKSPPAKGKGGGAKGGKGGKPTTAAGASSAAASGSGGGAKARLESTGSEAGSMEYKCLIRATLKREGKQQKEKISLIVSELKIMSACTR